MDPILKFAKTIYIQTKNLIPLLGDYVNPRDWISRKVKSQELIRLKNGLFLIKEKIDEEGIPFEQIANILYGPSYVSFEWALSYYDMIPEGVYVVTSASATKSRVYKTPIATFDYVHLSHARYVVGIDRKDNDVFGHFLMATPEKALADLVHAKCKHLTSDELYEDLVEGRRIDVDRLKELNISHVREIAIEYRSSIVNCLVKVLESL